MRERNKNGISSFLFSGSSMDVFSATGEETRWFSFLFSSLKSLYLSNVVNLRSIRCSEKKSIYITVNIDEIILLCYSL